MQLAVNISCCLCSNSTDQKIQLPEGWNHRVSIDSENDGFCPEHSAISEFAAKQCPGCVGGWGDCPLWKNFAFSNMTLTDSDMVIIESGVCPKRVNGTAGSASGSGEMFDIDLSEKSSTASGMALSTAIRDYCKRYHSESTT